MSKYITSPSPVDEEEYVKEILTRQVKAEDLKKAVVQKIHGEYKTPLQPDFIKRLTIVTSFPEYADLTEEEMRVMTSFELHNLGMAFTSIEEKVRNLFFPGNQRSLLAMCQSQDCSVADFYRSKGKVLTGEEDHCDLPTQVFVDYIDPSVATVPNERKRFDAVKALFKHMPVYSS